MGLAIGTEGDGGDACYEAAILSELPGGPHVYIVQRSYVTASGKQPQQFADFIGPLMTIQPYISEFRVEQPGDQFWWRAGGFRGAGFHSRTRTLLEAHLIHLFSVNRVNVAQAGRSKWLHVTPNPYSEGRVIINRTSRYQNPYFPWREIVEYYRELLLFVGLPHEHAAFCSSVAPVEFYPTKNLLEVAQLIAGSQLFIGNQSCANAVAEGLKHPLIQETSLWIPDCIFRRPNAQHVFDGYCILPSLDGRDPVVLPSKFVNSINPRKNRTPPEFWQYQGRKHTALRALVDIVWTAEKRIRSRDEVEDAIVAENIARLPDYFCDKSSKHVFDIFHQAMANAPS